MTTPSAGQDAGFGVGSFDASSLAGGQLADHQATGLAWLLERRRGLLADPTGSGKTATAVAFLAALADLGVGQAFWVTEANLITQTVHELARFVPSLTVAASSDRATTQLVTSGDLPDVLVYSYDQMARQREALAACEFPVVIFDEVAALKGPGVTSAVAGEIAAHAAYRLAMTATPVETDLVGTWRILSVLGVPDLPGEVAWGDRFVRFKRGFQGQAPRPVGIQQAHMPELHLFLDTCVLRRTDIGLAIPGLTTTEHWVDLTPPQAVAYEAATDSKALDRSRAMRTARGRMKTGLKQHHEEDRACAFIDGRSAKAEAAVRYLSDHPEIDKAVMWAENLDHLSLVEDLLDDAGIGWIRVDGSSSRGQRADAITVFGEDPTIRVLLGTRVLERGLDGIQHCNFLLSLGSSWNHAREEQRVGRLRRVGSPHPCVDHHVFLANVPHERDKWRTRKRRDADAQAVLAGDEGTATKVHAVRAAPPPPPLVAAPPSEDACWRCKTPMTPGCPRTRVQGRWAHAHCPVAVVPHYVDAFEVFVAGCPGGWGWYVGPDLYGAGFEPGDNSARTSLRAVLEAVRVLGRHHPGMTVSTEYSYVASAVNEWGKRCRSHGWRTTKGTAVKHVDLLGPLLAGVETFNVRVRELDDRDGVSGTQLAKQLAKRAAEGFPDSRGVPN